MNDIMVLLSPLIPMIPFVLLVVLGSIINLKKPNRSRQCYMPLLAIVFCLITGYFSASFVNIIIETFEALDRWIHPLVEDIDIVYWAELLVNSIVMLLYLIFKGIAINIMKLFCKDGKAHYETVSKLVYQKRPEDGLRYLKPHFGQSVMLMKALFYVSIILGIIAISVSSLLLDMGMIVSLYYPVFGIIMVGEIYYYINGPQWKPVESTLSGEGEHTTKICDYSFMRDVLSRNFGDKLMSDDTSVNSNILSHKTNNEIIDELSNSNDVAVESFGLFMKKQALSGLEIDQNYLASGLALLNGKSMIFNNPFYYDLIPYIFFPMNRTILHRKKVLVILGRHAIEQDVMNWCNEGLASVTQTPSLWKVEVLDREKKNPDVGIITRSSVYDLKMHETNAEFLSNVEFVMLIEPSRLITTAQIGLNSLIRYIRRDDKKIVFCTTDKNCDGLVDALSHVLMTSLEEVTATNKHRGVSSYMCWEADEEHLQHRMLPNISRYLGVGTELSFSALKNQISKTGWYGGDAFPVLDMHWISKQYYFDLLQFATLPTDQVTFDEVFRPSANMWDAKVQENAYLTVEDENYNMYEAKRAFSTRATEQGFINVISTDYLLKDYMAANDGIFNADSKAIPYIVADYAHTPRNVIYRLCLRMSSAPLTEEEIRAEMSLLNIDLGKEVIENLWTNVCEIIQGTKDCHQLTLEKHNEKYTFDASVIEREKRYSFSKGRMEFVFSIKNKLLKDIFLSDLHSAEYIAEDETDKNRFLGTELQGHIFQKYLPGQFFTFGGKYYEMLRLTLDGRVIVRRAADHINGRPQYRQIRNYFIEGAVDSHQMGDQKEIGGVHVIKQYAKIRVETPSYWHMQRYHDFNTAKKVSINGVPVRQYYHKQLLRIDFPEQLIKDKKTLDTLALFMNEIFRTLYAENQCMIVAVTQGQAKEPLSYSLQGEDLCSDSIYIIEDSQLDIGLLVSVERNLTRIFSILCDYLQWHQETLERSQNPPKEQETPNYVLTEEQLAEEEKSMAQSKKKGKGLRAFIKDFFKRKSEKDKNVVEESEVDSEEHVEREGTEVPKKTPEEVVEDSEKQEQTEVNESAAFMNIKPGGISLEEELTRKPYHQRYYTLYGGEQEPLIIDTQGVLELLKALGFENSSLEQARNGLSEAENIERNFLPNRKGSRYCDFCGCELFGSEYEILSDGRERCNVCGRTAVKTEKEFKRIYSETVRNLELFFGITINAPIKIQMVNAKTLHKHLGKTFVPTEKADGRILGVAIRDKRGGYSILLENGSPRLNAMMTMVHEMTHIWQYLNWDAAKIKKMYGIKQNLEVYEGMAKWVEIQYAYLISERQSAKREELITRLRKDAYGSGFVKYADVYPLSEGTRLKGNTPFDNIEKPL